RGVRRSRYERRQGYTKLPCRSPGLRTHLPNPNRDRADLRRHRPQSATRRSDVAAARHGGPRSAPAIGCAPPSLKPPGVCRSAVPLFGVWRHAAGRDGGTWFFPALLPSRRRTSPKARGKSRSLDAWASDVVSFLLGIPSPRRKTVTSPCQRYWMGWGMQIVVVPDCYRRIRVGQGGTSQAKQGKNPMSTPSALLSAPGDFPDCRRLS